MDVNVHIDELVVGTVGHDRDLAHGLLLDPALGGVLDVRAVAAVADSIGEAVAQAADDTQAR